MNAQRSLPMEQRIGLFAWTALTLLLISTLGAGVRRQRDPVEPARGRYS